MPFYQDGASIVAVKRIVRSWKKGETRGSYVTVPRPWAGEEVKIKLIGTGQFVRSFVNGNSSMTYATARSEWVDREVLVTRLKYEENRPVRSEFAKRFRDDRKKVVEESTTNNI